MMASLGALTERRVRLQYPDDVDPMWTPAVPEFACAANAVSLMMPVIEPYFVRTIAAASAELDEPLRAETEQYLAQERGHHGQHARFNRILVGHYPGLAPVERILHRAGRLDGDGLH
ncbi:MAG: metal-dependent hydrolase, partial [Actinomycetota bacterium]